MTSKDVEFWEWLLDRGNFPYWQDAVEVPLPEGFGKDE